MAPSNATPCSNSPLQQTHFARAYHPTGHPSRRADPTAPSPELLSRTVLALGTRAEVDIWTYLHHQMLPYWG